MESHTQQSINEYWLQIPLQYKTKLAQLRTWKHLKACVDNSMIWVRGLSTDDVASLTIRSIPFKEFYYQKENALFKIEGNLPEYRLKTSWIWMSLEHILPLELPNSNFNFFEFSKTTKIRISTSTLEKKATAQRIDWVTFENYIHTAHAIRLQSLNWVIIDQSVLIIGEPLLALPGDTFWQTNSFLLPTGCDFQFPAFSKTFKDQLNPNSNYFICFNTDGSFFKIEKEALQKLSISSYRKTVQL